MKSQHDVLGEYRAANRRARRAWRAYVLAVGTRYQSAAYQQYQYAQTRLFKALTAIVRRPGKIRGRKASFFWIDDPVHVSLPYIPPLRPVQEVVDEALGSVEAAG